MIYALKKHVNSDHFNILKRFEKKVNYPLREDERQPSKRDQTFILTPYLVFLLQKNLSRKMMCKKAIFGRLRSFNYQKPSSFTICKK